MKSQYLTAGFGSVAIIGIIAAALLAGGAYFFAQPTQDKSAMKAGDVSQETMMDADIEKEAGMVKDIDANMDDAEMLSREAESVEKDTDDETMMEKTDQMDKENTNMEDGPETTVAGTFTTYSADKLAMAATGDVVLFFHAAWCPSCRALESDINANITEIPENIHILKVDYDSETELKKKYGVVRQHTLVQVDENGTEIQTLTGLTNTLNQVVAQVN